MTSKQTRAKSRTSYVQKVFGTELSSRISSVKMLIVGAGGIGCELRASTRPGKCFQILTRVFLCLANTYDDFNVLNAVKNAVLTGFGDITLLDLDTIDLSNLNRQFLFKKKDVKQPKALVRVIYSFRLCHLTCFPSGCRENCSSVQSRCEHPPNTREHQGSRIRRVMV